MARMAPVVVPDYPHHVTQRGNRRQKTFFCQNDYSYYLELMSEYSRQAKTDIWAYCLMFNHLHLVRVPRREKELRPIAVPLNNYKITNIAINIVISRT